MAAERKVTVRVDISATGNLGEVLKQRATEAAKVKDSVKAIPKQISVQIEPADSGVGGMVKNRMAAKKLGYSPGMMWDDEDVRDFLQKKNAGTAGAAKAGPAMPTPEPMRAAAAAIPETAVQGDMKAMVEAAMRRKEKQSLRKQLENVAPSDEFKEASAILSRKQVAIEAGRVGNEANVKAVMQEVKLEEESLHLLKQKQAILSQAKLADLRSREGQEDALKTSRLTFQARGAAAVTAGEQSRADRRSIGSPEHAAAIKAEVAARWESAKNARMEARASNIAEYGKVGGNLVTFGQRLETAGSIGIKVFGGMLATAAAMPALFQTLTGSIQLAVGELAIAFTPTIIFVSQKFQQLAGAIQWVNEATGGWAGKIIGAAAVIGGLTFFATKVVVGLAPAFSLLTRGIVLLKGSADLAAASLAKMAVSGGGGGGGGGGGFLGMGGGKGMMGKIGIGGGIAVGGSMAANAIGSAVGGSTGDYISTVGESTAVGAGIGMLGGPAGAAVGAAIGFVVGNVKHFWGEITGVFKTQEEKSAAKLAAFSMNFQGGAADEDLHAMFQRESIRDPHQQALADQAARGMAAQLAALGVEIGGLKNAIAGVNQSWQVGN